MCLNPQWVYKKGHYKKDNYRGKAGEFYEIGTYSKCGSCEICINEKMNNWVIRNVYEAQAHSRKCFITLTYENSPYILVKKDFQDFLKRFRINLDRTSGEKIRFFEADEYGTIRGRPHAHFIIYGWDDDKAKYLGINKKGQIYYQSKIIQEAWGLGRTSYQPFADNEIPYLALYETPQESFKRAYKINHEKVKKLEQVAYNPRFNDNQRQNMLAQLNECRKELENSKSGYMLIKERNSWSQGLGWEEFYKNYLPRKNKYTWTEYVNGDMEILTPSPWVKKLANMGDKRAAEEMFRREKLLAETLTTDEERIKNELIAQKRKKDKIFEWNEQKTMINECL